MQLPWYKATLLLLKFCPPPLFQRKCQIVSHVIHLFDVLKYLRHDSLLKYENEILVIINCLHKHKHIFIKNRYFKVYHLCHLQLKLDERLVCSDLIEIILSFILLLSFYLFFKCSAVCFFLLRRIWLIVYTVYNGTQCILMHWIELDTLHFR